VRANAVECLWGLKSEEAIDLLESCLDDASNRVAGNALVGLRAAGQLGTLERIADMAIHGMARFRSTAAWAMGRVGDPLFGPLLNLLVKDSDPLVRSAALRALIEVRKSDERPIEQIREQAMEIALSPELTEEEIMAIEPRAEYIPAIELKLDGSSFSARR
jgi:HEAT repeat protein